MQIQSIQRYLRSIKSLRNDTMAVLTVNDESLLAQLRQALADDGRLSFEDVQRLIWSTFDYGAVTRKEYDDLFRILRDSQTMDGRSREYLRNFLNSVRAVLPNGSARVDVTEVARQHVNEFEARGGRGVFAHLDRATVANYLKLHVLCPAMLNQGQTYLCGPTSFMYSLASDNPYLYVRVGILLFETGRCQLGRINISPSSDLLTYKIPGAARIDQAHWMIAASLRDSENWFFSLDSYDSWVAKTNPREVERWFRNVGYSQIHCNYTTLEGNIPEHTRKRIEEANRYYNAGYRVVLYLNSNMMSKDAEKRATSSSIADHFVAMSSQIQSSNESVSMKVFSWGKKYFQIPVAGSTLSFNDFSSNFYGSIAAKY